MAPTSTSTSVFNSLLGDTLVTRNGASVSTQRALTHKQVIGIFFMASVCERCRLFTPALTTVYRNMQLKMYCDLSMRHELEIVVVSVDANPVAFRDFVVQSPFLAMPLQERTRVHELVKRYNVQRIPSVVFVDEEARVIEGDGRALIEDHYTDLRKVWNTIRYEQPAS